MASSEARAVPREEVVQRVSRVDSSLVAAPGSESTERRTTALRRLVGSVWRAVG